jgi:hypothetical protein
VEGKPGGGVRSEQPPPGPRRATLLAAAFALWSVVACGGDDRQETAPPEPAVYAAIIRAAAADRPSDGTPVVFVGPLDEAESFPLDLQVSVVEALGDDATVRFVDKAEEAIDVDADDQPVLDDGVLLRLGPVPPSGSTVVVDAGRFLTGSEAWSLEFTVSERSDGWSARAGPERPIPTTTVPDFESG